jgi:signal transduction histidine kinase
MDQGPCDGPENIQSALRAPDEPREELVGLTTPASFPASLCGTLSRSAAPSDWSSRGLSRPWLRAQGATEAARRWLLAHSFAPAWLPAQVRHPGFGYFFAVLLATASVLVTHVTSVVFPVPLAGIIPVLGVVLVALAWGTGASLFATLVSAALLYMLVLSPNLAWSLVAVEDMVAILLYVGVGFIVSLLASQTERARRHAERWALRERAAKQRMDMFLGMTGHELRTPLAGAKLSVQLAQRHLSKIEPSSATPATLADSLARAQDLLAKTATQLDRQNRLVADLVDVSRIQAGKLDLRLQPCDLSHVARDVVEEQRLAHPQRVILLELPQGQEANARDLRVLADPDRITQVVANYLSNALKYAPEDRPILARLERVGRMLRVSVRDQGPGLAPEDQARIWVPFVQASSGGAGGEALDDEQLSAVRGAHLGLGLYICRTIVERHGGQVGVVSARGVGSTFWFTLPHAGPGA